MTVSLQMYGISKASIEVHNIFHVLLCPVYWCHFGCAKKKMSKSLPTDPILFGPLRQYNNFFRPYKTFYEHYSKLQYYILG